MNIILLFLIAISLSMDAFSLSLAYGMVIILKKERVLLSVIVGIFHFFMPILGILFGNIIRSLLPINEDILLFLIFLIIGIEMILEKNEDEIKKLKLIEMILFSFAVSLDSFGTGIGINKISNNYILSSSIFSITSFIFTYIGLNLGNKISSIVGKYSSKLGGIILILLSICQLV